MFRECEVTVDGLKIRYLEEGEGSGEPVIMLHGASLGSSADVFDANLRAVAEAGFRALAYDQPGFGLSDDPPDYTLAYRTAFLPRFMSAVGAEKATLVGHSQAGGIVVRTALDHPERVDKVVVVCSGSLLQGIPGFPEPAPAPAPSDSPTTREDVRRILESNLHYRDMITAMVVEKRYQMSVGKNVEAFRKRYRAVEPESTGPRLWERLPEVRAPLLLIYGGKDRNQAAERSEALKERMPDLRLQIIDRAGHLLMWDAFDTYDTLVVEFLKGTLDELLRS